MATDNSSYQWSPTPQEQFYILFINLLCPINEKPTEVGLLIGAH
ncbi:hypothetical protein SAMN02583745_01898 [Thorsellia anophelis DSM 18579]|uniref:Uncharacterized protein n=1 Tax=Thorsellia anophelis DSM 18579 TaxID=1123402 RepID=A0A1I0D9C5_9GAMM|nr:hypothetical protein SAMN02583745_01898 [Thorsellia anophelis DSM 18579]